VYTLILGKQPRLPQKSNQTVWQHGKPLDATSFQREHMSDAMQSVYTRQMLIKKKVCKPAQEILGSATMVAYCRACVYAWHTAKRGSPKNGLEKEKSSKGET
jgi:hypothetical protein